MEDHPKVSVGIPVFNGEKTLARTIESILKQDYANIEIVISDNGSTDSTLLIAERYALLDSRIRIERFEENQGSISNFNRVFELANGEFFMWASHDDEHEPEFIRLCLENLRRDPESALCAPRMRGIISPGSGGMWVGDLGSFANKKSIVNRYHETLTHFPAVAIYGLYRSSMIRKTSLLRKVIGSDLIFIQNLSLYGTFIECDQILFTYHGRETWNTVDQDYAVFYGEKRKPWYFSPFLMVSQHQIRIIVECDHPFFTRLRLLGVLFRFQVSQILLKIALKIIKYAIPKKYQMKMAKTLYWRFIHSPNIKAEVDDKYTERVIRPIVGLRSK